MLSPANDNNPITFISMFSGIEAASVAFGPLGWKAVAFAEIEKFPSAVLAHHYPDVPNVGDMTAHDWSQYHHKVDIVCGGPPCQAFSVAGLRNSMQDARGNLSLSYMRALHAIDPRNAIVENVPGWLNTPDNAFGCFLAGIVGADDALIPSPQPVDGKSDAHWKWSKQKGRHTLSWPNAGMVSGPKGRAAWRIQDAQYHGLAQRRRRVLLVADFGRGADPVAVLFERVGMQGNPAPSREARKNVAPTISACTKGGGGLGTDFDLDGGLVESSVPSGGAVAYGGNRTSGPIDVAAALNSHGGPVGRLDFESETFVHQTVATIDASYGRLQGASGQDMNHGHSHLVPSSVVYSIMPQNSGKDYKARIVDVAQPIMAAGPSNGNQGGDVVVSSALTVALRGRDGGATAELGGEVATALRASTGGGDKPHVLAFQSKASSTQSMNPSDITPMLDKSKSDGVAMYQGSSAVRRLTPTECERLQGFPDGYTDIPWRGKPTSPDGPRYKALGNSWAVPKFTWLGRRIAMHMPARQATTTREAA
ncbi:DNA cytosine methyltransferase [Devosia neptuniae]|uniref:DNA (cytosine-5-)-methyltransferase n=1 Tax=Devosia neptuniae TaxID=191302 RepID=A0ABY6CFA2_9HYPH|nr:DNA cytosine methyltransferase [Devosia neptuniae]UXN70921.1 DNA cytosine methyltransferase [Devosia neptuniae]